MYTQCTFCSQTYHNIFKVKILKIKDISLHAAYLDFQRCYFEVIEHIKVKFYKILSLLRKPKKKRGSSAKGDNSMSVIIF